jgi:hypothetical protein
LRDVGAVTVAGFFAGLAALIGLAGTPSPAENKINWPDLPTRGFTVGRPATVQDVEQGNAVFSMNGTGGGVVSVPVPQYVFWRDESGATHPKILVQIEKAPDGSTIVGLRDFEGNETVATLPELELLGTEKPN